MGEVGGMRGILMDKVAVGHQNFQEELYYYKIWQSIKCARENMFPKVGIVNITYVIQHKYPGVLISIYFPTLLRKKA